MLTDLSTIMFTDLIDQEKACKEVIASVKPVIDNKREWKAKHKLSNEDIVVKSVSGTFPGAINLLKKDGSNF